MTHNRVCLAEELLRTDPQLTASVISQADHRSIRNKKAGIWPINLFFLPPKSLTSAILLRVYFWVPKAEASAGGPVKVNERHCLLSHLPLAP